MAFSDGDPFVSGSLYSFQQGNRMMQNYRGASVPSNLQDGALWSDSDDDRLWHQGASLDEVFTEQTTLTWENLLPNSGFGVWSQSNVNKGLATITYDTGDKGAGSAPSVGDTIIGGTSGASGKVISYTTASGTWAGGDAAGVVTIGAASHTFAFVDNEVLTFAGVETAAVNMPDSAVQVGLIQNGGFATDTDPPPGWTAVTATLTTEAAGKVGNHMQVASSGAALGKAYQDITTVIGKIYKLSLYFKKGTSNTGKFMIGITTDEDSIYDSGDLSDAAWTAKTATFEATATTTRITMQTTDATATENSLFDEISCYEITPCCLAADALACDGWGKVAASDIYRQHNDGGTLTKDGSFYSLKFVLGDAGDSIYFPGSGHDNAELYQQFAGRTVTFGAWIKTSTASHARLRINDYVGSTYSSYHTGGGAWEWLEVTHDCSASTAGFRIYIYGAVAGVVAGTTIIYVSQPMLVLGSHIGEGNYAPKQHEVIACEVLINSNKFNTVNVAGAAETWTELNLEADSDGKIPKGAKAVYLMTGMHDSGSSGSNPRLYCRRNSTGNMQYTNNLDHWADNAVNRICGRQDCGPDGDFDTYWAASGAGALTFDYFRYTTIQVT